MVSVILEESDYQNVYLKIFVLIIRLLNNIKLLVYFFKNVSSFHFKKSVRTGVKVSIKSPASRHFTP